MKKIFPVLGDGETNLNRDTTRSFHFKKLIPVQNVSSEKISIWIGATLDPYHKE